MACKDSSLGDREVLRNFYTQGNIFLFSPPAYVNERQHGRDAGSAAP